MTIHTHFENGQPAATGDVMHHLVSEDFNNAGLKKKSRPSAPRFRIYPRHLRWAGDRVKEITTWIVMVAVIVSQIQFVPSAEAASPSTTTVSAGSAPPPAATSVDSFQPDLFTGRATTSVPIAVPPGRKELAPSLALGYASSSRNCWVGVGWGMDLGYIERSTRSGVPAYDESDTFAFTFQGVNSELIEVYDGTYRARDEGHFLRFESLGTNGWQVTDKAGTRYRFGATTASCIMNDTNVYRWCLDRITDANGNTIEVTYSKTDGQTYLSRIDYTGHETLSMPPANYVEFTLEDRTDIEVNYRAGFERKISKRLASIETYATVGATPALARRYELSYTNSPLTGRSLLTSVTEYGEDGTTHLAPITFTYQDDEPTYNVTTSSGSAGQVAWNVRVAGLDVGHENFGCVSPGAGLPWGDPQVVESYHNFGGVQVTVNVDGSISMSGSQDHFVHAWTALYVDSTTTINFQQSGGWDVCCMYIQEGAYPQQASLGNITLDPGWTIVHLVAYHQHSGFSAGLSTPLATLVDVMSPSVVVEPQMAGDVDGDGVSDLINYDGTSGDWTVSSAESGSMSPEETWLTGFGDSGDAPLLGDWNADGRTDVALYNSGSWQFALSTGSNFTTNVLSDLSFGSGQPLAGDFNGDGFVDLGTYNEGQWAVALGDGSSFTAASSFDLFQEEGEPQLPANDVRWKIRIAGWDHGHENYGCVGPYDSGPPYGSYSYCSGSFNLGGVSGSVGGSGYLTVNGGQDHYAHSRIAVYLADGGTKSLTKGSGWDVACLYMQDDGGVHGPFSGSSMNVTFQPGWSHIHIVGYNQNQGFNYQLTSALTSMFDVVAPDPVTIDTNAAQYLTGDFNGDGLTDIGVVKEREVYLGLSDGSQFVEQSVWPITFGSDGYTTADYNGDGLSDLAWFDKSSGTVYVGYSDGAGFSAPEALPLTFSLTAEEDQIQIGELNGDGLPDLGVFDPISGDIEMALSSGSAPDLLVEISNGIGGVSGISYQPSTTMDNDFLPLIMPVVTHSRMADGMGNVYTTRYTYAHGLYDSDTREFRGFGEVDVYDAESGVTITEFHQDEYNKGRPYRMSVKDADGNLWSKAEKTWQSTTPFPGLEVYFTYLESMDEYVYDGDETYKQTCTRFEYDQYGNLTSSYMEGDVDQVGDERQTLTSFNVNESEWILSTPSLVQTLDADSNVVAQVRFRYDGAVDDATPPSHGNLTQEAEWLNLPTTRWLPAEMTYDDCGNMLTATDAAGNSISNTYDATGTYLETVRNALGHTRQTVYNPRNGQKLSETDANGVTSTYTYDALGRKTASSITDPGSGLTHVVSELEYDTSAVPVRTKITAYALPDKQGALISYQFSDGLGRNLQTRAPAEDPAQQVVTGAVEYDSKGQVIKQWSPYLDDFSESFVPHTTVSGLANPGQYEYDPMGRVVKITASNGAEESIVYDDWMVETVDANTHVIRKTRDAHGRLIEVQEHNDGEIYTTAYEYDALDNLVHTVDHAGNETFMTYDSQNRRLTMNDPDMGLWSYTYDDVDNLVDQTDARGVTVTHAYDALNRLTQKSFTTPGGCGVEPQANVVYEYDDPAASYSIGKLSRMTDASGVVEFEYDCYNRVTSETRILDGQDYSLVRGYDLMGRLQSFTYPNDHVVSYTYNPQGVIETVSLNDGAQDTTIVSNINYNAQGQLTRLEYGNGVVTDYSYNPQTLRLEELYTVDVGGTPLQDFTYSFDPVGNLLSVVDAVNTASQTFQYDDLNRLTFASGAGYGDCTYDYDAIGNMILKADIAMAYGEGSAGPHAVTSTGSGLTLTYDDNGNMITKASADGTKTMTYDAENRLVKVEVPIDAQALITLQPGWNLVGFPQMSSNMTVAAAFPALGTDYDQVSRYDGSTQEFESSVDSASVDQFSTVEPGLAYWVRVTDPAGAELALPVVDGTPNALSLEPGWNLLAGPPRVMSVTDWLDGLTNGTDYGQVKGFMAASNTLEAVSVVGPGTGYYVEVLRNASWTPPTDDDLTETVEFVYDGDGGRIKKINSAGTRLFVGMGYEVSPEGDTIEYIFAGSQRVASLDSEGTLLYNHPDHLGSSNLTTDDTGAMVELNEYTPYGESSRHEGSVDSSHRYTGQRLDVETGFYYYNARYYDSELGRFLSPDTAVQDPSDPQMLNRYSYVRNNPMVLTDPSGHFIELLTAMLIGAIIGALVNVAVAAITGGDIGQAALMGALQGAIFSGFSFMSNAMYTGIKFGDYLGRAVIQAGGGAAAGAAGAAVRGEPIGKAALQGAAFSFALSAANYAVGQWSGYSKDQATKIINGRKNPGGIFGGKIGTNGIATSPKDAIRTMLDNDYDAWLYNPTHGPMALGDLVESVQEVLFGPGSWSRSAAGILNETARSGVVCHFVAHSQGGLQFAHALSLMDRGLTFANTSSAQFVFTPVDRLTANVAATGVGLKFDYSANALDIVSALGNPWLMPTATLALPYYLGSGAAPHTTGVWNR